MTTERTLLADRIRMGRAFGCFFVYVLAMAGLQAMFSLQWFSSRVQCFVWLAAHMPALQGMWHVYGLTGAVSSGLHAWRGHVARLMGAQFLLLPFLGWWHVFPGDYYLAGNVLLLCVTTVLLLMGICRLAAAWDWASQPPVLAREASAAAWMVLYITLASVAALLAGYARLGLLQGGWTSSLHHLSRLPVQGYGLFLLPHLLTLYVLWIARGAAFRL